MTMKLLKSTILLLIVGLHTSIVYSEPTASDSTVTLKFKEIDFLLKEQVRATQLSFEKALLLTEITNYKHSLVIKDTRIKNDSTRLVLKDQYMFTKDQQMSLTIANNKSLKKQVVKNRVYLYITFVVSAVAIGYLATH